MALIGIAGRGERTDMDRFVDNFGLHSMPHLLEDAADLWNEFDVKFVSFWVLVRADGTEERRPGELPTDLVADALVAG